MKTIFLDKNPIFHYAQSKIFNEKVHWASLKLIEKIKSKEISVNIDCTSVFALYNYVTYKLKRTSGKSADEAQKLSRQFTKTLFMTDSWIIIGLDREHIFKAIDDNMFDLEDAWQFYGSIKSNSGIFLTWNIKHFKNGMTPKDFLTGYLPKVLKK